MNILDIHLYFVDIQMFVRVGNPDKGIDCWHPDLLRRTASIIPLLKGAEKESKCALSEEAPI